MTSFMTVELDDETIRFGNIQRREFLYASKDGDDIDLQIIVDETPSTMRIYDKFMFYQTLEDLEDLDLPDITSFGDFLLEPNGEYIRLCIRRRCFNFKQEDNAEFLKFLNILKHWVEDSLKNVPRFKILNATHKYIKEMQEFDIGIIAETMVQVLKLSDKFTVLPYPGIINLSYLTEDARDIKVKNTTLDKYWKKKGNKRYTAGILAIDITGDHYLAFVLDNKMKTAYLFDSLSTNAVTAKTGFTRLIKDIFPGYKIEGIDICSGCGKFEPLWSDPFLQKDEYVDQNIFCHTWSLWFIYQILLGVQNGIEDIGVTVKAINNACGTPRENLLRIKNFAAWLSKNILEVELPTEFSQVYNPPYIIESGAARDKYEFISNVTSTPKSIAVSKTGRQITRSKRVLSYK